MKRFICDRAERIGAKNGTKEIFAHPFFKGLDPTKLRERKKKIFFFFFFFNFSDIFLKF